METVLVFRTSVSRQWQVDQLRPLLDSLLNNNEKWNFDLEDCDRILRVESRLLPAEHISDALNRVGFSCEELED